MAVGLETIFTLLASHDSDTVLACLDRTAESVGNAGYAETESKQ